MNEPYVTVRRGAVCEAFEEIEWHFVRRWGKECDRRLLLGLLSFSSGTLPEGDAPLLEEVRRSGERMVGKPIESSARFDNDPLLTEVKRLELPWRHILTRSTA